MFRSCKILDDKEQNRLVLIKYVWKDKVNEMRNENNYAIDFNMTSQNSVCQH